jgi:hypothetical protein
MVLSPLGGAGRVVLWNNLHLVFGFSSRHFGFSFFPTKTNQQRKKKTF